MTDERDDAGDDPPDDGTDAGDAVDDTDAGDAVDDTDAGDAATSRDSDAVDPRGSDAGDARGDDASSETGADAEPQDDDGVKPREVDARDEDDDGGFLSNLTSPRKQLGDAAAAFKNARASSNLPRDDEGRAKLVCRRYAERRAVPIDDLGRPACYEEGHPDCEGCLEDVRDGVVETW